MPFSPSTLPPAAQQSFANQLNPWEVTAVAAYDSGMTDRDTLADIAFYHHHRDLIGQSLTLKMANYHALANEWNIWRTAVNSMFGPAYNSGGGSSSSPPPSPHEEDDRILDTNVEFARIALSFTKSVLPHGAGNRLDDVVDSAGLSLLGSIVAKIRGANMDIGKSWDVHEIRTLANYARAVGSGNCGEQSAVAFDYLHKMGVGPIDILSRVYADHQFVVIGRKAGYKPNPAEWGPHAAVCDPWMKKAYPAYKIGLYMGAGVRTTSTIRAGEQFCRIERK